jgi:hypothetical protein
LVAGGGGGAAACGLASSIRSALHHLGLAELGERAPEAIALEPGRAGRRERRADPLQELEQLLVVHELELADHAQLVERVVEQVDERRVLLARARVLAPGEDLRRGGRLRRVHERRDRVRDHQRRRAVGEVHLDLVERFAKLRARLLELRERRAEVLGRGRIVRREGRLGLRHLAAEPRHAQRVQHLGRVGVARLGLLGERAHHQRHDPGRQLRHQLAERLRVAVDHGEQHRRHGRAGEGAPPRQQLVEHRAEREDVGARVRAVAVRLLGRHVVRSAHHDAARGRVLHAAREPEVHDLDLPARQHVDVARLEVAVQHALRVGEGEPVEDLLHHRELLVERHRLARAEHLPQVAALEQLHRHVGHAALVAEVVDRDDIRVVELGGRTRLVLEALPRLLVVAQPSQHDLDRDVAAEHRVVSPEDLAHGARADLLDDRVLTDLAKLHLRPRRSYHAYLRASGARGTRAAGASGAFSGISGYTRERSFLCLPTLDIIPAGGSRGRAQRPPEGRDRLPGRQPLPLPGPAGDAVEDPGRLLGGAGSLAVMRRSAEAMASVMREAGVENVEILEIDGVTRTSTATGSRSRALRPCCSTGTTTCSPRAGRRSGCRRPTSPVVRNGRLFGRGTADDKAGCMTHIAAVASYLKSGGELPVNVRFVIEGEEEIGSENLDRFLKTYRDRLDADFIVLSDTANFDTGIPALTYQLRGICTVDLEVQCLERPVHSGMWGGPVPDPVQVASRIIADLTGKDGQLNVPGLYSQVAKTGKTQLARIRKLPFNEAKFKREAGLMKGMTLTGEKGFSVYEKIWTRPSLTVIAFEARPIKGSSNQIIDSVRARLSLRTVPNMDPKKAGKALVKKLRRSRPSARR